MKTTEGPRATVRAATIADVPQLIALYRELDEFHRLHHPELFPATIEREPAAVERMLTDPKATMLVAELAAGAEAAIVGFARVMDVQTPTGSVLLSRRFAFVDELVVAKEHRRVGIASELLRVAETWASARGIPALEVTVWNFNHGAQELYANNGYSILRHYFRKPIPV